MSKIGIIAAIFFVAGAVVAGAYTADAKQGDVKPGWGYGDKNHVHTGPPGQSVRAL